MESPSRSNLLEPSALWQALRSFLGRIRNVADLDTVLVESLDTLIDLLGADRGLLLYRTADGTPYPIHGRRAKARLKPREQAEVSRTTIQRVLDTGELVFVDPATMEATESIYALGIGGVLAGPLRPILWRWAALAPEDEFAPVQDIRGVVYLDFRGARNLIGPAHRELFQAAIELISLVLDHHEVLQAARASRTGPGLPAPENAGRDDVPDLADLLRPSSMAEVRRQLLPVARTNTPVLLVGESGTGKTLLARAIARASHRPDPFVRVNLGHVDDRNTMTSELFGHVRGSFTGAHSDRVGKVERADGGTLFLDEILNLPLAVQPLLLDLLQDGTFEPLGWTGTAPKLARVRIIAATNGDVEAAVRRGELRADLYHRLAGAVVRLPPLRHHREDIPSLAEQHLRTADGARAWTMAVSLRQALTASGLAWEGNVRQLLHLLDKATARALSEDASAVRLTAAHLDPADLSSRGEAAATDAAARVQTEPVPAAVQILDRDLARTYQQVKAERERLDAVERRLIELALEHNHGIVAWAAEELGMPRTGFASRMKTLDAERPEGRGRTRGAVRTQRG